MDTIEQAITEGLEEEIAVEARALTEREARRGGRTVNRPKRDDDLPALEAAAERSIEAVEQLPLGEPFDAAVTSARIALEAARQRADRELFPALPAVDAGTLTEFSLGLAALPSSGPITAPMIAFHDEALAAGRPDLALVIRTRGRKILARRAYESRIGSADHAQQAEQKALRTFDAAVARQLHSRGLSEPASGFLVERLPALLARFAAAEQQHVDHAAHVAERQRLEAEQAQTRAQTAEAELERLTWTATLRAEQTDPDPSALERRRHLASVYRRYPRFIWRGILGRDWTGLEAAAAIDAGAPFADFYRVQSQGEQPAGYRS